MGLPAGRLTAGELFRWVKLRVSCKILNCNILPAWSSIFNNLPARSWNSRFCWQNIENLRLYRHSLEFSIFCRHYLEFQDFAGRIPNFQFFAGKILRFFLEILRWCKGFRKSVDFEQVKKSLEFTYISSKFHILPAKSWCIMWNFPWS